MLSELCIHTIYHNVYICYLDNVNVGIDGNIGGVLMPYINSQSRTYWKSALKIISSNIMYSYVDSGTLNYIITKILTFHLGQSPKYEQINLAIGVLECCKLELYRRIAVPYEEKKREENGDVF